MPSSSHKPDIASFRRAFISGATDAILVNSWMEVQEDHGRDGIDLGELLAVEPGIRDDATGHAWLLVGRMCGMLEPDALFQMISDAVGHDNAYGVGVRVMNAAMENNAARMLSSIIDNFPSNLLLTPYNILMPSLLNRMAAHLAPLDLRLIMLNRVVIAGGADGRPSMAILVTSILEDDIVMGMDIETDDVLRIDTVTGQIVGRDDGLGIIYTGLLAEVSEQRMRCRPGESFPFFQGDAAKILAEVEQRLADEMIAAMTAPDENTPLQSSPY